MSLMNTTTSNAFSRRNPSLQPSPALILGSSAAIRASPIGGSPPDTPTLAMHSIASFMSGSPLMM